ncbi:hypothetical protein Pan97_09720 [Bremerella volcania]|uniref:Uncharacterized protein n=1 Tax=Bremerella volcania TaxID=2527984 RepID=A0A518C433_9BACT|nr:hypothetical protein [Bremerella volcania]QDU73972.1 hypothetical protein Pan97_09720 [Bremerella volcania]
MKSTRSYRGWVALGITGLCIAGIWGIVLPALAQTEIVREREAFLEANRINPAAMFYTELECLDPDK